MPSLSGRPASPVRHRGRQGDGDDEVGQAGAERRLVGRQRLLQLDPDTRSERLAQRHVVLKESGQAAERFEGGPFLPGVDRKRTFRRHDRLGPGGEAFPRLVVPRPRHDPEEQPEARHSVEEHFRAHHAGRDLDKSVRQDSDLQSLRSACGDLLAEIAHFLDELHGAYPMQDVESRNAMMSRH